MSKAVAALRPALFTMAAVLASFAITYALCARFGTGPSPAILAAALCVGLMRRPEELTARAVAAKLISLPLVALCAGAVGVAFLRLPLLGAALFTAGVSLSILLRRYGERWAALGRIIALPLLTMLVVPVRIDAGANKMAAALLVLAAGIVSVLCASVVAFVAQRAGAAETKRERPPREKREAKPGAMPTSTRMALQMLTALVLAFTIGFLAFPEHWSWVVLSAFIVCSGAVGRGDAIYKALLRLGGAIGGTLIAAVVARVSLPNPAAYATVVFTVLFAGIWLRQLNYAFWAACATLIFALLQGAQGDAAFGIFAVRVVCISIGALCAVVATWFVYPIRTEQVVRRRVADALGAMREVLAGGDTRRLDHHAEELHGVAPPVRLHRALFGAKNPDEHPATWIERAHALIDALRAPDYDRAGVGAEMRSLRDAIVKDPPGGQP